MKCPNCGEAGSNVQIVDYEGTEAWCATCDYSGKAEEFETVETYDWIFVFQLKRSRHIVLAFQVQAADRDQALIEAIDKAILSNANEDELVLIKEFGPFKLISI